ncbi:hypothetical protein D9M68_811360 [compost metagenome]
MAKKASDVARVVHLGGFQQQPCVIDLAFEEGLGQRWALVGQKGLRSDQSDAAFIAFVTQLNGQGAPGMAGADDNGMGMAVHDLPSRQMDGAPWRPGVQADCANEVDGFSAGG